MSGKSRSDSKIRKGRLLQFAIIAAVVLSVGALFAAIFAKPLVRGSRSRTAGRLGEQALEIIRTAETRQDMQEAQALAYEANSKDGQHPNVLRAFGELYRQFPGEEKTAVQYYEQLSKLDAATASDQLRLAELYFKVGKSSLVPDALAKARELDPDNPRLALLEERHLGQEVASTKTEESAAPSRRASEGDLKEALEIAASQLRSANPGTRKTGFEGLWNIARRDDKIALDAMSLIAALRNLSRKETEEIIQLLEKHPEKGLRQELIASSLQIRMNPQRKNTIIKEEVLKRAGTPLTELSDFFVWLQLEGGSAWVLDLIDIEKVRKRPDILEVYLEAMASEGRWDDLDRLLATEDLRLEVPRKMMLQTRIYHELGREEEVVRASLSAAILRAAKEQDFGLVATLVEMAQEYDYKEIVIIGLDILKDGPYAQLKPMALLGYFRIASQNRDSEEMLTRMQELREVDPENESFESIEAYLLLLKGTEIEKASASAHRLTLREPVPDDRKLIRALAAYRFGDNYGASTLVKEVDVDRLPAGMRAVYAFLYAQSGQDFRTALEICEGVAEPLCLPEETLFRRRVLGR